MYDLAVLCVWHAERGVGDASGDARRPFVASAAAPDDDDDDDGSDGRRQSVAVKAFSDDVERRRRQQRVRRVAPAPVPHVRVRPAGQRGPRTCVQPGVAGDRPPRPPAVTRLLRGRRRRPDGSAEATRAASTDPGGRILLRVKALPALSG